MQIILEMELVFIHYLSNRSWLAYLDDINYIIIYE